MAYHRFVNEDGEEYGSFETFLSRGYVMPLSGWYWWPCSPGCMPDGDAMGPFPTEHEAMEDAICQ